MSTKNLVEFLPPLSEIRGGVSAASGGKISKIAVTQILSKKSATKFRSVKTSSGKVVATSFLYLTVHRRIAGDVSIHLKFALKVTRPFRKRRFRQISLNSATAVRAREKKFNYRQQKVDNALSIEP